MEGEEAEEAAAVRAVEKDTLGSEFEWRGGRIFLRNELLLLPPSRLDSSAGRLSVPRAQKAERKVVDLQGFGRIFVMGLLADWRMLLSPASSGSLRVLDLSPAEKDTG